MRTKLAVVVSAVSCALSIALLSAPAGAAAGADPLVGTLLRTGEQPGYSVSGKPTTFPTVASYAKSSNIGVGAANTLKKAGFVLGAGESLSGSGGLQGFSDVFEFKTRAGAKQWTAVALQMAKASQGSATVKPFRVPGVRDARGITAQGKPEATANAYWTEGRCAFGSGLYVPNSANQTASHIATPVTRGIEAQFRRVRKVCA